MALFVAGCEKAVLDPAGPTGAAERVIQLDSLAIMLAIVVPTIAAALAFGWWFRAGNARARYMPTWAYSGRIELVIWSVPLMTILLLGGVTWVGSHELDPAQPIPSEHEPLQVEVVSLDWKWLFIYPQQDAALVNQLVVPVGVPVHFSLTSASVMNTFFVPRLGSMIYTMNGMRSQLNLLADREGEFPGLSGHFSGDGFAEMHFTVRAVPDGRFAAALKAAASPPDPGPDGRRLDDAAYRILMQPGTQAPSAYGSVEPGLFDRIVSQAIPPAPGPKEH